MEITSTVEVSSTRPCGIMPMRAATVVRMAWDTPAPSVRVRRKSAAPMGPRSHVAQRMIIESVAMISELADFTYLASALMRAA